MSKRLGKLAILVGFVGVTLIACVKCATSLLVGSFLDITFIIEHTNIIRNSSWLVVAVGFCITFLAERNAIDLLIAGGFGIWGAYLFSFFEIVNNPMAVGLISLLASVATFLWVCKVWKSHRIAAIAIIVGMLLSFLTSFIISFLNLESLLWLVSFVSVIENATLVYAAYLDMRE